MSESELPNPTEAPDPLLDSGAFIQPDEPEQARNGTEFEPGSVIAAEPISMVPPEEGSTPTAKPVPVRRNPEEMAKRPSWLPEDWKIDLKVRTSVPEEETIIPESDEQIVENNEPEPIPRMETDVAEEAAPALAEGSRPSTARQCGLPDWLPKGWRVDVRQRSSGRSVGKYDKYYVELSTNRRFRSKNEVLNYLATGSKRKRKVVPEADPAPASSPPSQKKRKSGKKNRKSSGSSEPDPQGT